jgi:hypothetical protein
MLRRPILLGGLAVVFASAPLFEDVRAQPVQSQGQHGTSLKEVKEAVLVATGYGGQAVELAATKVQFVITLVNSKLVGRPAAERETEASRIASVIASKIADKPEFEGIQAIHVDYVTRVAGRGHTRTIDGIDFRKDPKGNFQHHIT